MKHYYSTVNDVICTHSDMQYEKHSRRILVRFERPNETGFDFAEGTLPECVFTNAGIAHRSARNPNGMGE